MMTTIVMLILINLVEVSYFYYYCLHFVLKMCKKRYNFWKVYIQRFSSERNFFNLISFFISRYLQIHFSIIVDHVFIQVQEVNYVLMDITVLIYVIVRVNVPCICQVVVVHQRSHHVLILERKRNLFTLDEACLLTAKVCFQNI